MLFAAFAYAALWRVHAFNAQSLANTLWAVATSSLSAAPLFAALANAAQRRAGDFNVQNVANTAWAIASVGRSDASLFAALAKVAKRQVRNFETQRFAIMTWALTKANGSETLLFAMFASAAERHRGDLFAEDLASTAWAMAMVGHPESESVDLVVMLDTIDGQDPRLQELRMYYLMMMQCLATTGHIVAGFQLLTRGHTGVLVSQSGAGCYSMFHTLLEACRSVDDSLGASRVKAAQDHLGLVGLVPVAVAKIQA